MNTDLSPDIQSHIEDKTLHHIEASPSMSENQAFQHACRDFGDPEAFKVLLEVVHDTPASYPA